MKKNPVKKSNHKFVNFLIILFFVISFNPIFADEGDLGNINSEIDSRKQEAASLRNQADIYREKIRLAQEEALSLSKELKVLENKIAKTEIEIKATEKEIDATKLEIGNLELQVNSLEGDIDSKKNKIEEFLILIDQSNSENLLEVFLANDSFSDFFNELEYSKNLQANLQENLENLKQVKDQKKAEMEKLQVKETQLDQLKQKEIDQQAKLEAESTTKQVLLNETQETEDKFYNLYWQSKQEQQNIDSEIYSLEKHARELLAAQEKKNNDNIGNADQFIPDLGSSNLMWPVSPARGITAYFHDPEYPYRYIFEHPGIDIRAYQGTELHAAASGYVASAKDNGYGYNYIMIIHANGLSSVYGHVSKIYVQEDTYVTKGQVIGLSGGMPGTLGAGRLTTGPHLHFEVRLNGIPVNPLEYLP